MFDIVDVNISVQYMDPAISGSRPDPVILDLAGRDLDQVHKIHRISSQIWFPIQCTPDNCDWIQ